jgi:hypothetical protein
VTSPLATVQLHKPNQEVLREGEGTRARNRGLDELIRRIVPVGGALVRWVGRAVAISEADFEIGSQMAPKRP